MSQVLSLHHVTAIASDPQRNLDFYAGLLGLRLVKRTVNFDDPETYHFYFGDEVGTPGSIMTFFPWPGARRGRQGTGQVAVTSFAVLPAAMGFWVQRLLRYNVKYEGPVRRLIDAGAEMVLFTPLFHAAVRLSVYAQLPAVSNFHVTTPSRWIWHCVLG